MPRNGSGTYTREGGATAWEDDRSAGTKIRSDLHDTHDQDMADALTASIAKDGQTTTTAIIPFAQGLHSGAVIRPTTNDGAALGTGTLSFSDLFLASGGVINFNNGDVLETHSANTLTWTGATSGYVFSGGPLLAHSSDAGGAGPNFIIYHQSATPAANDVVGSIIYQGIDSGGNVHQYADIDCQITDTTNGSEDGILNLQTSVAGSVAPRLIIGGGLYHTNATGGDKGDNTINFGAVYDDNSLLCAPIEFVRDGAIDLEKWEELAPYGTGQVFQDMLDDGYVPTDPQSFVDRMMADSAVPGLFTEPEFLERQANNDKIAVGEYRERVFLAIDNIGLAIKGIHEAVQALTARVTALEAE
jgi:hypothetical protein